MQVLEGMKEYWFMMSDELLQNIDFFANMPLFYW